MTASVIRDGVAPLTFACRLRNRLLASLAHIREMVFHAGLDTALGNGVNIAARLERIAEPGGICNRDFRTNAGFSTV